MPLPQRIPVVIVRDAAAASFYGAQPVLDSVVSAWRRALLDIGADVEVRSPARAKEARAARVLVVPSSPCLTAETREAMDEITARGGGIVLTGLAGYFDAGCRPLGYGLVVASSGASRADTLETRPMVYVTLPAGNPLTADIPPGARLDLNPAGQVALRHPSRDAFYSDYSLQPSAAGGAPLLDGAIARTRSGRGRFVYWGFELTDAVRRPWNHAVLRLLVRNSVAWAAALPTAAVEPWRGGRFAAAALAQDVENQFVNAEHAVDSLRAAGVRSTFFLTSDIAARHARLSEEMANAGEVGTHTENHRLLGGTPADEQRHRLRDTQRALTRMFGLPVLGLRPPREQFDVATMTAWAANGGRYVFGANDSRTAAPEILAVGEDTVVLIGRIASDDIAAVTAGHDARVAAKLFANEYQRLRALGGMYVLSYHSQLLARPDLVPALARTARLIAADTAVWLTTVGDIAEWWRERAQLEATVRMRESGFDVVVRNRGERLVRGAVVRVELPTSNARAIEHASTALLPAPPGLVRLLLPPVPGEATRVFAVNYVSDREPVKRTAPSSRAPHRAKPRFWWFPWWR
jgi:peptidoglycan/xylan/chitin deacetylase (PgdA/CDA1 family)